MDKTSLDRSKLDILLSEKEKNEIDYLNNKSNKLQQTTKDRSDPFNKSLAELINLWASSNVHVIIDLTNFFSGLSKYSSYFDDIDATGQWFTGIGRILRDLVKIFTKGQRSIYIGATLILISFGLYLIQITS